MQIVIQARNLELTRSLRGHAMRRLKFALGNYYQQIQRILVRLTDINGPRGGYDKRCQIEVIMPRLANVVIEDTEDNAYLAISRAVERAGRTVARKVARERKLSQRLLPEPL